MNTKTIFAAIVLSIGISACNNAPESTTTDPATTEQPTTTPDPAQQSQPRSGSDKPAENSNNTSVDVDQNGVKINTSKNGNETSVKVNPDSSKFSIKRKR